VDTERDFILVVSSFHQTYKANKRRSFILVPEGNIHTQGTWRSLLKLEKIMLTYLPLTLQQAQNTVLG
jgi:hypothetical protein